MSPYSRPVIAVAMSGGVDSSVAAALLRAQGHDIIGIMMRVVAPSRKDTDKPTAEAHSVSDARRVAEALGIGLHVVDLSPEFERGVIADFADEYAAGRTPNPCFRCNQRIKFGALLERARALGAETIATGHYVRLSERGGRMALSRAADLAKDQSYTLAGLSQEQLRHALFPLGDQAKEDTREMARSLGLATSENPDSQDICFLPDLDYRTFLVARIGPPEPGPILNTSDRVLGKHKGLTCYTIGQRKGLDIASERPLYVLRLDVARNALIVGHEEETCANALVARETIWGALPPQERPFECLVKVRYRAERARCTVIPEGDVLRIGFHTPQRAITPGQWAVLYDGDYVAAAALITDSE